jgi:hypothetical protein
MPGSKRVGHGGVTKREDTLLTTSDRAELGQAHSKVKEVHEFLSDALEALGGEEGLQAIAEIHDPNELGRIACTIAFEQAVLDSLPQLLQGRKTGVPAVKLAFRRPAEGTCDV